MTLFNVPDMSCAHCKATIETALHAVDGTAEIKVDLTAKTVAVADSLPTEMVLKTLDAAGYTASVAG